MDFRMEEDPNTIEYQRDKWAEVLTKEDWNAQRPAGYGWGDPENAHDPLGNYAEIKKQILGHVTPETTVLEIGTFSGKWTQHVLHAKEVICVDLSPVSFNYLKHRHPDAPFTFYTTEGDELRGISDGSVDFIYSMDSLVRAPFECIAKYFAECSRVLKKGGTLFLHLPSDQKPDSTMRKFTSIGMNDIAQFTLKNRLTDLRVDDKVIKHGVIVQARKWLTGAVSWLFEMHELLTDFTWIEFL